MCQHDTTTKKKAATAHREILCAFDSNNKLWLKRRTFSRLNWKLREIYHGFIISKVRPLDLFAKFIHILLRLASKKQLNNLNLPFSSSPFLIVAVLICNNLRTQNIPFIILNLLCVLFNTYGYIYIFRKQARPPEERCFLLRSGFTKINTKFCVYILLIFLTELEAQFIIKLLKWQSVSMP